MIFAYFLGAATLLAGLFIVMPDDPLSGLLTSGVSIAVLVLARAEDNSLKPQSNWDRSYDITDDPNDMPDSTWRT